MAPRPPGMDLKRYAANGALVKGVNANDQSNGRRNQRAPYITSISGRFGLYRNETRIETSPVCLQKDFNEPNSIEFRRYRNVKGTNRFCFEFSSEYAWR
jgi:hypothetical protein